MPPARKTDVVILAVAISLAVGFIGLFATYAIAQDSPKVIDNPGGGQVVIYGPINENTPQAAMADVLRYVHTRFGDTPVVGKFFQPRDANSVGAFFTVTAKTEGNKKIAGLMIVSIALGAKPAAAILDDDAVRFATTEPILMRTLDDAWRTASTASASSGSSESGAVPPLTPTRFPDGSGAVNLPPGWRVTFASHGAAVIEGSRGEAVLFNNSVGPIYDLNDPGVRARLRYANPNNLPILCSASDALRIYMCVLQRRGAQFQLKRSQPMPALRLAVQAVLIDADIDLHDGKGVMSCELGLGITALSRIGARTLGINGTCAPQSIAAQDQPTLKAVWDSYTMDSKVVASEFAGDKHGGSKAGNNAPNAGGNSARVQAYNASAAEAAQRAAFEAHMNNIDRFSKSFQNYQLDQTELQDSDQNARGAVPNSLADALIKANPDRFQAVPTPNFLKGTDF